MTLRRPVVGGSRTNATGYWRLFYALCRALPRGSEISKAEVALRKVSMHEKALSPPPSHCLLSNRTIMLFSRLPSLVLILATAVVVHVSPVNIKPADPAPSQGNGCILKTDFDDKSKPNPWDNQPLRQNGTSRDVGVWLRKRDAVEQIPLEWYVNATGHNNTYRIIQPVQSNESRNLGYVVDSAFEVPGAGAGMLALVGALAWSENPPRLFNIDKWLFHTDESGKIYLGLHDAYGDLFQPLQYDHGFLWYANPNTWCPPPGQGECDGLNFFFGGNDQQKFGQKVRIRVECPYGVNWNLLGSLLGVVSGGRIYWGLVTGCLSGKLLCLKIMSGDPRTRKSGDLDDERWLENDVDGNTNYQIKPLPAQRSTLYLLLVNKLFSKRLRLSPGIKRSGNGTYTADLHVVCGTAILRGADAGWGSGRRSLGHNNITILCIIAQATVITSFIATSCTFGGGFPILLGCCHLAALNFSLKHSPVITSSTPSPSSFPVHVGITTKITSRFELKEIVTEYRSSPLQLKTLCTVDLKILPYLLVPCPPSSSHTADFFTASKVSEITLAGDVGVLCVEESNLSTGFAELVEEARDIGDGDGGESLFGRSTSNDGARATSAAGVVVDVLGGVSLVDGESHAVSLSPRTEDLLKSSILSCGFVAIGLDIPPKSSHAPQFRSTRCSTVQLGDFDVYTGEILCTFVWKGGRQWPLFIAVQLGSIYYAGCIIVALIHNCAFQAFPPFKWIEDCVNFAGVMVARKFLSGLETHQQRLHLDRIILSEGLIALDASSWKIPPLVAGLASMSYGIYMWFFIAPSAVEAWFFIEEERDLGQAEKSLPSRRITPSYQILVLSSQIPSARLIRVLRLPQDLVAFWVSFYTGFGSVTPFKKYGQLIAMVYLDQHTLVQRSRNHEENDLEFMLFLILGIANLMNLNHFISLIVLWTLPILVLASFYTLSGLENHGKDKTNIEFMDLTDKTSYFVEIRCAGTWNEALVIFPAGPFAQLSGPEDSASSAQLCNRFPCHGLEQHGFE
ncbi:uncharacterized protein BDR25DRAFT_353421 [Lindgomyces ingoldianus]|uniref:Uncharacterized protein n=1 Tax=Lindgomyces ingoldianus TaxID=673940 RepID=A0ACB6QZG7_9PLEO|nr:uncharacterized protein BDR25DRAFT_353421 [Lindgomyces ingoldianus]KAF2472394.1 hypothetical protein BDR25DRAFT_353421 [Lindgomyces ingoldianus]